MNGEENDDSEAADDGVDGVAASCDCIASAVLDPEE